MVSSLVSSVVFITLVLSVVLFTLVLSVVFITLVSSVVLGLKDAQRSEGSTLSSAQSALDQIQKSTKEETEGTTLKRVNYPKTTLETSEIR